MRFRSVLLAGVFALVGMAAPANAAVITGHIGFSAGFVFNNLTGGLSILDFAPTSGPDGGVIVVGGTTGYFSTLTHFPPDLSPTNAHILDLTNDPTQLPATATYVPAGVDVYVPNVISGFGAVPADVPLNRAGLHFDMTKIVLQSGTACTGFESGNTSCVEGPFVLTHTDEGMKIQFDIQGYFVNDPDGAGPLGLDTGFYGGSFSAVINGLSFPTLWSRLGGGPYGAGSGEDLMCGVDNLEIECTVTANFDPIAPVPEPITLVTLGAGSLVAGAVSRRRKKNAKQ